MFFVASRLPRCAHVPIVAVELLPVLGSLNARRPRVAQAPCIQKSTTQSIAVLSSRKFVKPYTSFEALILGV
ncbi:hypothetical protein EDD15DRAFT_2278289 [Pisolithus albus]|nr:hypothetical protein EDD15DRAFT_2278289 [Pisolithus albus]